MAFVIVLWITIWVIIAFAFMGLFTSAYAWDYYKTMQTQYIINPNVCMMLPDPEVEHRIIQLENATNNALNEWQFKLHNATGGNWEIYRTAYEWEEHKDLLTSDFPDCSAFVNYSGQPDSYMANHGILGIATVNLEQGYYWLEIQTQLVKRTIAITLGSSFNESSSGVVSEPKLLSISDIENIIKHEFGHALGLEHFYCNDNREDCIDDSIMYPKLNTFSNSTKSITDRDINMIIKLYGIEGFGSPHYDSPLTCIVSETKTC